MNSNLNVFSWSKKVIIVLGFSLLASCSSGESPSTKSVVIDGSSTVFPITNSIAESFNKKASETIAIEVETSGSLAGFAKFCQGETDINNASVPIPQEFMKQCKENGVAYIELPVAFDALTVVINPDNDWAQTMTVTELKALWQASAENKITNWQQINSQWPDKTVNLFAPGQDSGTYKYFNEAILGGDDSRQDYVFSEFDEALVRGVSQDSNAIAYFGYAYYQENQDQLKAVAIDNGTGGVTPSEKTISDGSYRPLTRPLFIYVNAKKAQENKAVQKFVQFYLQEAETAVAKVGYLPLPSSGYHLANIHFEENQVGTIFNGSPVINASINELLTKTYASEDKDGYVF